MAGNRYDGCQEDEDIAQARTNDIMRDELHFAGVADAYNLPVADRNRAYRDMIEKGRTVASTNRIAG